MIHITILKKINTLMIEVLMLKLLIIRYKDILMKFLVMNQDSTLKNYVKKVKINYLISIPNHQLKMLL